MVWQITGTYNNQLAYDKFAVFALTSSLLVPDAAKLFRQTRKDESAWKRSKRQAQRNLLRDKRLLRQEERRINKLADAVFQSCRRERHQGGSVFPPPHWVGEPRPKGARRFVLKSNFPKADYLTYLVSKLGYGGDAAIAALSRAHNPWTRPPAERRKVSCRNADEQALLDIPSDSVSIASPEHPYRPASPSRRTKVGGGLTEEQVQNGLRKMRTDAPTKQALFEIVYRRRSTLQVSDEYDVPVEILYVYASRLRGHIRTA